MESVFRGTAGIDINFTKKNPIAGVLLHILQIFSEQLFYITPLGDRFCCLPFFSLAAL